MNKFLWSQVYPFYPDLKRGIRTSYQQKMGESSRIKNADQKTGILELVGS
ncbi:MULTISPECIES: hypothetical protein [unclassified Pseudoalteromonas]|nr:MULTISPECIES: hypothetical protein [unclassified Pseudoalteromonas]AUJ71052.1 hypothetical protein PNC201_13990 [Pseudoalteromonas sp. NC201]MBR8843856.1 hypothetical protein [Pseudoalteromonas sp. JC3]WJE08145.1 hypothetical protein QSH61_14830 [Pseudoalteromonas sp. JC3]